jgi:hypothetical protein
MGKLQTLSLRKNKVASVTNICALGVLTNLRSLSLHDNPFATTAPHISAQFLTDLQTEYTLQKFSALVAC